MAITGSKDQLLVNLMSAATTRYKVLSSNLSNANTPGYVRSTVAFEDLLAQELSEIKPDLLSVVPEIQKDIITPGSPDGNNVNTELEMNGLIQNRLQYELYSTLLAGRMELVRSAIQEGR